jgi:solute carrier family 25 uncoupling protein 8/9
VTTHILRTEGLGGFFKGWSANYARLGPQTAITFVAFENLRLLAGLGTV